jgi:MFS family permease
MVCHTLPGSLKWRVVGMLWFICFFNYADRQSIFSVFPLLREELHLSNIQLGLAGSAFMWTYAVIGPFVGWLVDRFPRKQLILGGLIAWSIITAATALSHSDRELIVFRALTGLGEAVYFPASMSLISDYHGRATRSRAMSLHQTSVYAGTIAGGALCGLIAELYGWRKSFVLWGAMGVLLGVVLSTFLPEPARGMSDDPGEVADSRSNTSLSATIKELITNRSMGILVLIFMGANFVAVLFLAWMPSFLFDKFRMSLSMAGLNSTAHLQIASVVGVVTGGVFADRLVRYRRGGRMIVQSIGLICGAPFLLVVGWTLSVPLLILAMIGFGYCKGLYDANIWASLYDVVPAERRGAAAGIMNSLGWVGGGVAPVALAYAANRFGMGACISATSMLYLLLGCSMIIVASMKSKSLAAGPSANELA